MWFSKYRQKKNATNMRTQMAQAKEAVNSSEMYVARESALAHEKANDALRMIFELMDYLGVHKVSYPPKTVIEKIKKKKGRR